MANKILHLNDAIILVQQGGAADFNMTLDGLGADAARQSQKIDLGNRWAQNWTALVTLSGGGSAPSEGTNFELWQAPSDSATPAVGNTAGTTGSDSAYTGYAGSSIAASKRHARKIGIVEAINVASLVVRKGIRFDPISQFLNLIGINWDQALDATADASNIVLLPTPPEFQT